MLVNNKVSIQPDQHEILIRDSFMLLKPVCDEVVQNPTFENCTKLVKIIDNVDDVALLYLLEYVIFPVQFHLHKHISADRKLSTLILTKLLECLKQILSKTQNRSINKFMELSILLLQLVLDKDKQEIMQNVSEDVKYGVIDCILSLYENLNDTIISEIYNRTKRQNCNAPVVYMCTQVARNEQLTKLRVVALKCILAVARANGEEYTSILEKILKHSVRQNFSTMFPGIISTCHYIITSNSILHRNIFIYSVRVFSRIVTLIFENKEMENNMVDFLTKINRTTVVKSSEPDLRNIQSKNILTDEWFKSTAEMLILPCKSMVPLCNSLQWTVRLELVTAANLILSKCSSYIISFSTTLLEILIILSQDSMQQVSQPAKTSLKLLLDQDSIRSKSILESLEENLISLLELINSAVNSVEENVLLLYLNLLDGYLNVLNLNRILKLLCHLQNLISTLIKVVRFEPSTLNSFNEHKVQDLENNSCYMARIISWKNTKYLTSRTEVSVNRVCATIAQNIDLESIAYYLLNLSENNTDNRKEIIFLINNIVLCEKRKYNENDFSLMKTILKTYLDSDHWCIPSTMTVPLSVVHSNILQGCLLIEGIGNMSICMGKNFNSLLLLCLYPVIEKTGCPNEFLSLAGLRTIKIMSEACGYCNVTELISDNVDYIMHNVNLKLRNLKLNAQVFDVLSVIIIHCQQKSITVLCDIIETLLKSDALLSDAYCEGYLNVFKMFIRKLRTWFAPVFDDDKWALNESDEKYFQFLTTLDKYVNENKNKRENRPYVCYIKDDDIDLQDIFNSNEVDFSNATEEENERNYSFRDKNVSSEEPEPEPEPETESKAVPHHVDLIVSIANRILHILSNKNTMNKAVILEILMDTLLILTDYENHLLPLVHKIWSPLENRLIYDSTNPLIMRRCFELLCILAVTARDFIRNRTLKKVLPIINNFLMESAKNSRLKDKNSVYRMSQQYKFQRILLNELGYFAIYVNLQEKEINSILVAVSPYLDSKQPKPLQETCVNLFAVLASQHREMIWLHMMSIWPPDVIMKPPSTELNAIKFEKNENNNIYEKNVLTIIQSSLN